MDLEGAVSFSWTFLPYSLLRDLYKGDQSKQGFFLDIDSETQQTAKGFQTAPTISMTSNLSDVILALYLLHIFNRCNVNRLLIQQQPDDELS